MSVFLLVGDWPQSAAELHARGFAAAGLDVEVRLFDGSWDEARKDLLAADCLGAAVSWRLGRDVFETIDMVAASARISGGVSLAAGKSGRLLGLNTIGSGVVAGLEWQGRFEAASSCGSPCLHDGVERQPADSRRHCVNRQYEGEQGRPDVLNASLISVLGTNPVALSCVLALSQTQSGSIVLLGHDKEEAKTILQHFLDLMKNYAYATMMPAAEEGRRNLLQAYEEAEFRFGTPETSSSTLKESDIVVNAEDFEALFESYGAGIVACNVQAVCSLRNPSAAPSLHDLLSALHR